MHFSLQIVFIFSFIIVLSKNVSFRKIEMKLNETNVVKRNVEKHLNKKIPESSKKHSVTGLKEKEAP